MTIPREEVKVRLTFTEECLGMTPADEAVYTKYIASQSPDAKTVAEELESLPVDEVVQKAKTVFPKTKEGQPFYWDYQIIGAFKDACGGLRRAKGTLSSELKAYKKIIDMLVFVEPRQILIDMHGGGELGSCERSLRTATPQGEQTALANSETVPAGSTMEFTIVLLDSKLKETVFEWLDYGTLHGLGQWRGSGKGRFKWEQIDK